MSEPAKNSVSSGLQDSGSVVLPTTLASVRPRFGEIELMVAKSDKEWIIRFLDSEINTSNSMAADPVEKKELAA